MSPTSTLSEVLRLLSVCNPTCGQSREELRILLYSLYRDLGDGCPLPDAVDAVDQSGVGKDIQLSGVRLNEEARNRIRERIKQGTCIPDTRTAHSASTSYYLCTVRTPANLPTPYTAECLDIIERLHMSFVEGEAFKASWRMCAARQGQKKEGNTQLYDAKKLAFYAGRVLATAHNSVTTPDPSGDK